MIDEKIGKAKAESELTSTKAAAEAKARAKAEAAEKAEAKAEAEKKAKIKVDAVMKTNPLLIQETLRNRGKCPMGYDWFQNSNGFVCTRGGHTVTWAELAGSL